MRSVWACLIGLVVFLVMLAVPAPTGLSAAGWHVAAILAIMVVWWIGEAVPPPVTGLLPLMLLPVLGVMPIEETVRAHASPLLALTLGGIVLAAAARKAGLHWRIARLAVRVSGASPHRLILAVMILCAFVAMWIATSVAVTIMMEVAVALTASVTVGMPREDPQARNFACAMIIGVAYACMFGSLATLTGNPMNALAAGMLQKHTGESLTFLDWMTFGLPVTLAGVPLSWWILTKIAFRFRLTAAGGGVASYALPDANKWSGQERGVIAIFAVAIAFWLGMPLLRLILPGASDAGIAVAAAILLFVLPGGSGQRMVEWSDLDRLPWGILLIIAGVIAMGAAIGQTGLDQWLAAPLRDIHAVSPWLAIVLLALCTAWLTELVNNIALVTIGVPVAIALATGLGVDPVPFAFVAAVCSSLGFIVPGPPWLAIAVSTPPVRVPDLARAGALMLIIAPLVIAASALFNGVAHEPKGGSNRDIAAFRNSAAP